MFNPLCKNGPTYALLHYFTLSKSDCFTLSISSQFYLSGGGCWINFSFILNPETDPSNTGLPNCVQKKNVEITSEQKELDSSLPRLLYELDEACKRHRSDGEKSNIANNCIQAASSPNRKYRILKYFEMLEKNKVIYHDNTLYVLYKMVVCILDYH